VSKGWTGGEKNSHNHEFVEAVNEVNIGMMMRKLLHDSPVIKEMVDNGTLILAGAIYDVETGKVRFLDQKGK